MPRARSAASDSDEEGGLAEKEAEYARLQREYRTMQGDRQAYTEQAQSQIRKQRTQMSSLENEKAELLSLLNLTDSEQNQRKDEKNVKVLGTLAQRKEDLERDLNNERKKHQELDKQIHEWENKLRKQQKSMGGVNMGSEFTSKTNHKVRILNGRLDKALQRFNNMLTGNSELRKTIDSLRVERIRFEEVYAKMNYELQDTRRDIGEIIENSKAAYEQREESQTKMILLREKNEKDQHQHNTEKKELIRLLEHDRKLREFMNAKSKEREEDPQLAAWRQKQAAETEQKRAVAEESVQTYEQAFERVQTITGEKDLELLVERFVEVEDSNFALFNYVSEQHNRIELLHEEIQSIKLKMQRFEEQGKHVEADRQVLMKQLEERQLRVSMEADNFEQAVSAASKLLDQLKTAVDSVFTKVGCDRSVLTEMLGGGAGINDDNIVQHLGIIEQKTNELLAVRRYVDAKESEKSDLPVQSVLDSTPEPRAATAQVPQIVPPALGDEFESEDEEDEDGDGLQRMPLTRAALENRVIKIVKKREVAQNERDKQRFNAH